LNRILPKPEEKADEYLQDLALLMALHCVRNTVIEDYHAKGKLIQNEMKAFNKEVANKLYTMLQLLLSPHFENFRESPMFNRLFYRPSDWDKSEIDKDLMGAVCYIENARIVAPASLLA